MQHAHIDTETNASERRKVCTKCERELLEAENFYIDHRRNRPHSRCKRCWDEKTREWIVKHPERRREIFVRSSRRTSITKTGMGVAEYERRWVEQSGKCAICEKPETKMNYGKVCRLAVDHDHRTGKLRGLLCGKCNAILGMADDDADVLERSLAYLLHHRTLG